MEVRLDFDQGRFYLLTALRFKEAVQRAPLTNVTFQEIRTICFFISAPKAHAPTAHICNFLFFTLAMTMGVLTSDLRTPLSGDNAPRLPL